MREKGLLRIQAKLVFLQVKDLRYKRERDALVREFANRSKEHHEVMDWYIANKLTQEFHFERMEVCKWIRIVVIAGHRLNQRTQT